MIKKMIKTNNMTLYLLVIILLVNLTGSINALGSSYSNEVNQRLEDINYNVLPDMTEDLINFKWSKPRDEVHEIDVVTSDVRERVRHIGGEPVLKV